MTDQQKAEVRALTASLDRLTRHPKRITPSAPWIIPATMIFVTLFALVALVIKLFMNYLHSKNNKTKKFGMSEQSSPDIPTTPEDQTSMATTASMRTRGSLRLSQKQGRTKPQPVSLYQMRQKHSPGSKSKSHKAAMKVMSRAAGSEANRSLSRDSTRQVDDGSDDNTNDNNGDNSPNLSQRSDMTDELDTANIPVTHHNSEQPEVHIVQIRDLEDNVQHSQQAWPQTESEI